MLDAILSLRKQVWNVSVQAGVGVSLGCQRLLVGHAAQVRALVTNGLAFISASYDRTIRVIIIIFQKFSYIYIQIWFPKK